MDHTVYGVNTTADNAFGPQLPLHFDFTLLFEHAIFTILPSSLLIAASPLYLYRLVRKPVCVRSGLLLWTKLAAAVTLLAIELTKIALWSASPTYRSTVSLAAASLSCINATCIVAILVAKHRHSYQPSILLSIYLSITILFDAAKARSCFRRPGLHVIGVLFVVAAVLKLAIVLLEELSKRSLLSQRYLRSSIGKESTSGFWGRSLFLWLNSTMLIGFRNIITADDLQDIGEKFSSERLFSKFKLDWARSSKASPHRLMKACSRTLLMPCLTIVLPRLCFIGFKFAQPFLLQTIVNTVGQRHTSSNVIGGLIGATALIYFGMAVTRAYYTHLTYRMITMTRGILVSAIFKKTLSLDSSHTKNSAAVTLMSTDIDGIARGLAVVHDIWASLVELGLGIYILVTVVGKAAFLVVMPTLVMTVASGEVARRIVPANIAWNEKIQQRVSATSSVLAQMKGIKMCGLTPMISTHLQGLRTEEIEYSKKLRVLHIMIHAITAFASGITPVVVLAGALYWTTFSGTLSAAEAFTTLSIISLVSAPLMLLMVAVPIFASIFGCIGRIQEFLLLNERTEVRNIEGNSNASNSGSSSHSISDDGPVELDQLPKAVTVARSSTSDHCAVEFINASIAAADDTDPILQNASFAFGCSKLTMVIGPVGCGKSTLLRAILGEAKITQGHVNINTSSIAFCDQSSWIQNISIRNNILGQSQFDTTWYETVIHACLLDEDMAQLPEGDQSLAGSGGVNLSGGQKQRVALARAIYSRKRVLVLDDVFSALDQRTSRTVFSRLLGESGILQDLGTITIMATHSVEHLSVADKIFVLDGKGGIKEQTGIEDDFNIREFLEDPKTQDETDKTKEASSSSQAEEPTSTLPTVKPPSTTESSLERQRGDTTLYLFYIKSIGVLLFAIWIGTVALASVSDKMPQIFLRVWIDKDAGNNNYFIAYAILCVTSFLCTSGMLALFLLKLVPRSAENLHLMMLETVMNSTLSFLTTTDSGFLLNRFSQDMTLISQVLPLSFMQLVYLAFFLLADIGIIISGAKHIAALIPALIVALYLLQKFYLRTSRQMRHLDLEAKTPLYTQFTEMTAGLQHIRAFGWQSNFLTHSLKLLDHSQKPYYYMFCIQRWLHLALDFFVLFIALALVTFALNLKHTTSQGAIGLALLNVVTFSEALTALFESWIEVETSLGALARLRTFINTTPVEKNASEIQDLPQDWPAHGAIEFGSVSARYNGEDETSRHVLHDLSIKIQPGQKVGIIGRTGSGKSSMLLTVLHLLDYSGSLRIDGIDISQIHRQQLRSRITTLPQDAIELAGSVRENLSRSSRSSDSALSYTPPPDAEIIEALTRVGMWDHIVARGGLDAELSSIGLSQGQSQLLNLAGAIIHNRQTGSKVVLVDEATSNMDQGTDAQMQAVMSEVFAGCTVLTIAHRLETLREADVILKLDEGRLVEVTNRT